MKVIVKITIIRHEKVDMSWNKKYNSAAYDLACDIYDRCPIVFSQKEYYKADNTKTVYVSELPRTYETACRIFNKRDFYKTEFLNEVPLRSFKDTDKMYPLWLWNFMGRLQWLLQIKRQMEDKEDTIIRADEMIKLLEKYQQDCYLISHGFYMRTLIRELKKQGYKVKKSNLFRIANLDMVIAEK